MVEGRLLRHQAAVTFPSIPQFSGEEGVKLTSMGEEQPLEVFGRQ
jgi:hypothetical protein